jgi:hypothetical protein
MKKRTAWMLAVAFGVVGFGVGARGAATVMKSSFAGDQAFAGFSGSAPCDASGTKFVSVNGFLNGANQIFKQSGTPTIIGNGVEPQFSYSNDCTNTFVFVDGTIPGAFTPPDKKLTSAGMFGSGTVQDLFGSGQTFPVSVDVVVEGTGAVTKNKSSSHSKTGGGASGPVTITINHQAFATRSADASGTLTIDGVTVDLQFSFANMTINDSATATVSH